jgi:transposase
MLWTTRRLGVAGKSYVRSGGMNPVIGVDISKGESHAQAFLDRGKPYGKTFRFEHVLKGLDTFLQYTLEIESHCGYRPAIVMEATGHYQSPVVQLLEDHGFLYIIINPLISHQARKSNLRKVKTDMADAFQLGELYYKEELEPYKKRGLHLLNLRYLTRQHESLTEVCVQAKLQFHAVLDQVFPEYRGVFGELFSKVSLRFLALHPTSQSILNVNADEITDKIRSLVGHVRSDRWSKERSQKAIAAAERNPFKKTVYSSHLISLELQINLLLQYQEHLDKLEKNIDALAAEVKEYDLLRSIPGIGEIDRFDHARR